MFSLQSPKYQWEILRSAVTADDSALTTFDYDSWPTSNTFNVSEKFPDAESVKIAFYGKDTADEDVAYKLYGRYRTNGPICLLLTGVATLGTQVVTKDPISKSAITALWADTITTTAGTHDALDVIGDSATNMICTLTFPLQGVSDLYLELNLGTSTTEISAIITGCFES